MKQPKILVTGATGRTGSAVVDELLAKDVPVRALVHSKDARSEALERKGAETVVADMFDLDRCWPLCAEPSAPTTSPSTTPT